jgi:hypothetical protein
MKLDDIKKALAKEPRAELDEDEVSYLVEKAESMIASYPCAIKPFIHCVYADRFKKETTMVAMTFGKSGRVREVSFKFGRPNPNQSPFSLTLNSKGLFEALVRTEPHGQITHYSLEKLLGVRRGVLKESS